MIGKIIAGRYRLLSLLGEGGMGAVYRAEDLNAGTNKVAVKLLYHGRPLDPESRAFARFCREARVAMAPDSTRGPLDVVLDIVLGFDRSARWPPAS